MFRADHATAKVDANGSGKDGYTDGNPGVESATVVTADALNAFQEEIANVVEDAGITLDKLDQAQLLLALNTRTKYAWHACSGANGAGTNYAITDNLRNGAFTVASDEVNIPDDGVYLISLFGEASSSDITDPLTIRFAVETNAALNLFSTRSVRFSAANVTIPVIGSVAVSLSAGDKIRIRHAHGFVISLSCALTIVQLTRT